MGNWSWAVDYWCVRTWAGNTREARIWIFRTYKRMTFQLSVGISKYPVSHDSQEKLGAVCPFGGRFLPVCASSSWLFNRFMRWHTISMLYSLIEDKTSLLCGEMALVHFTFHFTWNGTNGRAFSRLRGVKMFNWAEQFYAGFKRWRRETDAGRRGGTAVSLWHQPALAHRRLWQQLGGEALQLSQDRETTMTPPQVRLCLKNLVVSQIILPSLTFLSLFQSEQRWK